MRQSASRTATSATTLWKVSGESLACSPCRPVPSMQLKHAPSFRRACVPQCGHASPTSPKIPEIESRIAAPLISFRSRRQYCAEIPDLLVDIGFVLDGSRHFLAQEQAVLPPHLIDE